MSEQTNVEVIQQIYAAYGRGDIAGILSFMTEDVEHDEPAAGAVPYKGVYKGHSGIREFFESAFQAITVEQFSIQEFVAQGDTVIALGHYQFRARATQRSYETNWAMVWRLKDGKVTGWTTLKDSAAEAAALQA